MLNLILIVIAFVSISLLVYFSIKKTSHFLIYLLAIKPFIDITINAKLFGKISALQISGVYVLLVLLFLYSQSKNKPKKIENEIIIWVFIILHIPIFVFSVLSGNSSAINSIELFTKVLDGYLVYFVSFTVLKKFTLRLNLYKTVWLSTFAISCVTMLSYLSGAYTTDVTKGVVRVGGLYNDPGSPAYLANICIMFAFLYMNLKKKSGRVKKYEKLLFAATFPLLVFIQIITFGKSSILMLLIFIMLWWGLHQRKAFILIPLIAASFYFAYASVESVQKRFAEEVRFIESPTYETARTVGTGRMGRWMRLRNIYLNEYSFFEKMFGTGKAYNAHNQFFADLLMGGITLLAIFVLIIYKFYKRMIWIYKKTRNIEVFYSIILLTCFMALSISGHPFFWTTILWYLMVMLGIVNITAKKRSVRDIPLNRSFVSPAGLGPK